MIKSPAPVFLSKSAETVKAPVLRVLESEDARSSDVALSLAVKEMFEETLTEETPTTMVRLSGEGIANTAIKKEKKATTDGLVILNSSERDLEVKNDGNVCSVCSSSYRSSQGTSSQFIDFRCAFTRCHNVYLEVKHLACSPSPVSLLKKFS